MAKEQKFYKALQDILLAPRLRAKAALLI